MKHLSKRILALSLALILAATLLPGALAEEPAAESEPIAVDAVPNDHNTPVEDSLPEENTLPPEKIPFPETPSQNPDNDASVEQEDAPVQLAASEDELSGTYSNGIQWHLNLRTYHLTITGSGDIPEEDDPDPWGSKRIETAFIGEGITSLASGMFSADKTLRFIQLPGSLKHIGSSVFANASGLTSILLPAGLESIGDRAFYNCKALTSVLLPYALTSIGDDAFYGTGLISVSIPNSVKELGSGVFAYAVNLRSVTLPQGLTEIPDSFFLGATQLRTVDLPDTVTSIGSSAFKNSGLSRIELPDGLSRLGVSCFNGVPLQSISIPGGVSSLPAYCFRDCRGLREVSLNEGLKAIDSNAFYKCANLSSIVFPSTLETVSLNAFQDCPKLTGGYFRGPGINASGNYISNSGTFYGTAVDFAIYYLADQPGWDDLTDQGCSETTWYDYPLKVWDGSTYGALPITDYYRTLSDRTIRLMVPGFNFKSGDYAGKVTATVISGTGETTVYPCVSSSCPYLTYKLPLTDADTVTFTCDGLLPLTIPAKLLGSFNHFRMWQPRADGAPVIQYVLLDQTQGSYRSLANIRYRDTVRVPIASDELYSLYACIDWGDQTPGRIRLMQGSRELANLKEGRNYNLPLGRQLYASSDPCSIRLDCSGFATLTELNLLPQQPNVPENLGLETGDSGHSAPMPNVTEILEDQSIALDLSGLTDDFIPLIIEAKPDGTVRATLGLSPVSFKTGAKEGEWSTAFNQIKDALGSVENNQNLTDANKKNLTKLLEDRKSERLWGAWGVSAGVQLIGYLEGVIDDETGLRFTECAVLISGKGGLTAYYPYAIGPFNLFKVYTKAGVEVEISVPLLLQSVDSETDKGLLSPKGDAYMDGQISFFGGPAIGNDAVRGALLVTGEFTTKNPFPLDWDTTNILYSIYLSFEGEIKGVGGKWKVASTPTFYMLKNGQWCNEIASATLQSLQDISWFEPERDYLNAPSQFLANDSAELLSTGEGAVTQQTLLTNVYPYAKVQQAIYSNGDRLLVWLGDNPDRTDGNRSALYFSCLKKSSRSWSTPALVTPETGGTGTADFYPILICEDDTAYLVWCDAEIPQLGDAGDIVEQEILEAQMRALNIGYARFDRETTAFADHAVLAGPEDWADVQPVVTLVEDQPVVVWASNPTGSLSLADEETALLIAALTNSGWEQAVLDGAVSGIDGIAAAEEEGALAVYYTRQKDGGTDDLTARELYRYCEGTTERLTDNKVPDSGPTIQAGKLTWYQDGFILAWEQDILVSAEQAGDRYQYLRNAAGTEAILYSARQNDGSGALYVQFCEDTTTWGEPVLLAEADSFHDYSGVFLEDGALAVAASQTTVNGDTSTTDLVYYEIAPSCDLSVVSAEYDPFSLMDQGSLGVLLDVENTGSVSVYETKISFYDGETLLGTDYSAVPLISGTTNTLTATCPLGLEIPASLRVEISPTTSKDPSSDNNFAQILLNHTDLSLEAMYAETILSASKTSATVTVHAVNRGITSTAPTQLTLHQDSADGAELAAQTIPALEPGTSAMMLFQLEEPLAEGSVVYAAAEELDGENVAVNNSLFTLTHSMDLDAAGTFSHTAHASMDEQGITVTICADNSSTEDLSACFLVAAYCGDQMLSVTDAACTLPAGTEGWVRDLSLTGGPADTVKVFLLDQDNQPLSAPQTIPIAP